MRRLHLQACQCNTGVMVNGLGSWAGQDRRAPTVTATAQGEWRSSGVAMGVVENTAVRANFREKRGRVTAGRVQFSLGDILEERIRM